jgi:hypothetical protein
METEIYTSVTPNESHRFLGEFHPHRLVTGSSENAPWSSYFTPLGSHDGTVAYDLTAQFTSTGQSSWVKMNCSTVGGLETWKKMPANITHSRTTDYAFDGTPYLVGPL